MNQSSKPRPETVPDSPPGRAAWLNRSTAGIALASLFSDISHELATAVLPALVLSLGGGPAALGWIEGSADGASTLAKLWGGSAADRVSRKKPLASVGYLVTAVGVAAIALCTTWLQVLVCRVAAWIGRGSRSAPRDLLMAGSAAPSALGRAFGLERAGDALGAVVGPLIAVALLAAGEEPGRIVLWSVVPGVLAFLAIALIVVEKGAPARVEAKRSFAQGLGATGAPFRRYLAAVALFGCGDFSRSLLILYVSQHAVGTLFALPAGVLAIALYVLHNAVSAMAALPLGALADRIGRRPVLVAGNALAAATTLAFALLPASPWPMVLLFVASGVTIAAQEVAEKALAVELLSPQVRGVGLGVLAATNGLGDLVSSAIVGTLWSLSPAGPALGFCAAAGLQAAGALAAGRGGAAVDEPRVSA